MGTSGKRRMKNIEFGMRRAVEKNGNVKKTIFFYKSIIA